MRVLLSICAAASLATALSACATDDGYGRRGYASSGERCQRAQANNRVAGTVVGAGVGALAGSAIAGNSSNTAGTIAGAVVGGVIGNQLSKPREPCPDGYYERDGYRR
ncbi:MAG: glycine zipper 2TM domain-containing protein [Caulobacteraceae bacterium]